MAWIWRDPEEILEFGTLYDYDASQPATNNEPFAEEPVDPNLRPVFHSRSGLKRFKALHCPPFSGQPVVDAVWRDIIRTFVPADRIQFLPVRLIARGEVCDDFMYAIPFDRRLCIDAERSNVRRKIDKGGMAIIFSVTGIVHHPDCLQGSHMARDLQLTTHLVISDELRGALAATGEDSVFWPLSRIAY
ncbi:hypothetical protein DFR52_102180 [Hoeflea marina]|uniref:Uncharacterized protein n=1 Tax=Hoeflea marina TaxID=274592 RepID=A0A317PN83_9HYPH|nr:hypothetical protein [Hoeflea marina]PWW01518.1 hypothetical protein DFR52_102180 [Hoeflea marina]